MTKNSSNISYASSTRKYKNVYNAYNKAPFSQTQCIKIWKTPHENSNKLYMFYSLLALVYTSSIYVYV